MEGGFTNAREDLLRNDHLRLLKYKIMMIEYDLILLFITPLFYTGQAIFLALPIHNMCQL